MRLSAFLSLCLLTTALTGCKTGPAENTTAASATPKAAETKLPTHYQVLTGDLQGIPYGAEVELALLEVNARARPSRLLGSVQVQSEGQNLAFSLPFDPTDTASGQRLELRGRVIQSGQLIMKLPTQSISMASSQSVGTLRPVATP